VKEFAVAPQTRGAGSTWDVDLSADRPQTYLYTADGENNFVWMLLRQGGEILGTLGRNGRAAGQFHWIHNLAVDAKGNLYTTEARAGGSGIGRRGRWCARSIGAGGGRWCAT
jgi:DNA-binding beta-propeller fold protein YncE